MAGLDAASVRARASAWARNYTPFQLVVFGVITAGVLLLGSLAYSNITRPDMALLYGNLSASDTSKIVAQLEGQGIAYELGTGGTSVLVPASSVDSARVSLAGQGLPKSGTVGWELLDNQSLTTSSFQQQVDYQRALEGEIDRTLMSIDGVDSASVHLVLPQDKLFSAQQSPATASVTLTTSRTLADGQVQAIVHLVSASVPNLTTDNVTVTDSAGNLLAGGSGTLGAGGSSDITKIQSAVEADLTAKAETMLSQVLGNNATVVRVSADLNFDKSTLQSETFDPNRVVPNATTTTKETYNSSALSPSGVVSSVPTGATDSTSSTNYTKDETTTNNSVSRTVSSTEKAPGAISRLTVSVAVDQAALGKIPIAQIQTLVSNAVGLNSTRGDLIQVTSMPFATPPATPAPAVPSTIMALVSQVLGGVVLLFAALFLLLRLRSRTDPIEAEEIESLRVALAEARAAAAAAPTAIPTPSQRSEADQLLETVAGTPAEAAKVLRSWIAEDQTPKGGR